MSLAMLVVLIFVNCALIINYQQQVDGLLYPFKRIDNASHVITLTPDEWNSEFKCNIAEFRHNGSLPLDCYRDENIWINKHVDEIHDKFKLLIQQESVDQRLADKVYLSNLITCFDHHHYLFNSGDKNRDKQHLEKYVVGSRVDDKLCNKHLEQMVSLLEDFSARVERRRNIGDSSSSSILGNALSATGQNETNALDERHFRLARVLDSYGRYESGQLGGRYHSFGMYHQCIRTPMLLARNEKLVESRYCWTRLDLDAALSEPLRNRDIMDVKWGDFALHLATCLPASCHSRSFAGDGKLQRENMKLVQRLVDSQFELPSSMYINQSLSIKSVFCLVDHDSPMARLPPSGLLFVAFIVGWTCLCAFSTYKQSGQVDNNQTNSNERRNKTIWSRLDLYESLCEFTGERDRVRTGSLIDLDPLNFVKILCTFCVILMHSGIISSPVTMNPIEFSSILETGFLESGATLGFVLVDTFFVVSGIIVTYANLRMFTRKQEHEQITKSGRLPIAKHQKQATHNEISHSHNDEYCPWNVGFYLNWIKMFALRYLRLIPLYFLVFWMKKSLFTYLGSGPNWDYGLNKETLIGGCKQESWFSPLTPMSIYNSGTKQCLPQSWTIANDIAFSLIIPPVTLLLFRLPKLAYLYSTVIYSLAMYFGILSYLNLDPRVRFQFEQMRQLGSVIMFKLASYIYEIPHNRVPAILTGVISGYIVFKWEEKHKLIAARATSGDLAGDKLLTIGAKGSVNLTSSTNNERELSSMDANDEKIGQQEWPWWFRVPLTYFSIIFIFYIMSSGLFVFELSVSSSKTRDLIGIYIMTMHHTLWSITNAIVLMRMVSDWRKRPLMRLLGSPFFKIASKLSYATLLLHWDIIQFDSAINVQPNEFRRYNYFKTMAMTYIYTTFLGTIAHVVFETPMDKLIKAYIFRL